MDDKNFFVVAVTVAFAVPVVFGGLYFCSLANTSNANDHIAKLENRRELLFFGKDTIADVSNEIISDGDYETANYIDFEIDYAAGPEDATTYSLVLKDIETAKRIDKKNYTWRLTQKNEKTNFYDLVSFGTFSPTNSHITLGTFQLTKNESHNFRIYYYLNSEVTKNDLVAQIAIE